MKLLIVDDDTQFALSVFNYLKKRYTLELAHSIAEASLKLDDATFDLIILDYELPDGTGATYAATLRAQGKDLPILMLTGYTEVPTLVDSLYSGADDYLTKPFQPTELIARIDSLLRRRSVPLLMQSRKVGDLTLDANNRRILLDSAILVSRPKEYSIFELLCQHIGETVSKKRLWENLWEDDSDTLSNALEVHVCRLRKALRKSKRVVIATNPAVGYILKVS